MRQSNGIKKRTPEELRNTQASVYKKVQDVFDKSEKPSSNDLRKLVTDRSLRKSKRLSKEELDVALLYFNDKTTPTHNKYDWSPDYPLEKIAPKFFTKDKVERLIQEYNKRQHTSSSLIPIKGISKVMQAKLRNLYIYDTPTLLNKGRTQAKRNNLAAKLDIDVKLVNSWVKQADLWRVEGMTPDMAYLLVQIGVRCVEDLAKVDVEKAYPILQSFNASQIDFVLVEKIYFKDIIKNAENLLRLSINPIKIAYVQQQIKEGLLNKDNDILKQTTYSFATQIETTEKPPLYLFKTDFTTTEIYDVTINKILEEGLSFLDDMEYTLPLPRTISGTIFIKKAEDPYKNKKFLPGVLVEISGIVSPTDDKTELNKKPRSYTDSNGRFIISMPEKYSIKEALTIVVSEGAKKQKFLITASDFIDSVPEQKTLNDFLLIDSIGDRADELLKKIKKLKKHRIKFENFKKDRELTDAEQLELDEINILLNGVKEKRKIGLEEQLSKIEEQYKKKEEELTEKYNTNYIKVAFERFRASSSNLNAEIKPKYSKEIKENDGFIVIQEIFEERRMDIPKAMPSVKLMGDGENIVKLPTDTAPSNIFSYKMLQRLKEPSISTNKRKTLNQPLDIETFKQKMYEEPDTYPQMSSLGIGYTLNMHQAWVPDGFALGSLLYSTILAPGEEQRLIVRENKQRYTLYDKASGTDSVSENYALSQEDDATSAFNYAVNQLSQANSGYSYSTKASSIGASFGIGGVFDGVAAMFGLSGGHSRTSGKGSSSARQLNSHNEALNAAQNFQHSIKSASDRISRAKRISMQAATSEVSDSVATKIIANHNHSHAMTIQYWEIMRRYRMETCIDSIDLVLFVPLKVIPFLPKGENFSHHISDIGVDKFYKRYDKLIKHANVLQQVLPYKYRKGLNILRKYASYPKWKIEDRDTNRIGTQLTFTITGNFLEFDNLSANLVFKNGMRLGASIEATNKGPLDEFEERKFSWRKQLKEAIKNERKKKGTVQINFTFDIPNATISEDLNYIELTNHYRDYEYELELPLYYDGMSEKDFYDAAHNKGYKDYQIEAMWMYESKRVDLHQDMSDSGYDRRKMRHAHPAIPRDYLNPNGKLSSSELRNLGAPKISSYNLSNKDIEIVAYGSTLHSNLKYSFVDNSPILLLSELQKIEDTLRHVAESTIFYSQRVWASLSSDERAMLLEQYTINMDFENLAKTSSDDTKQSYNNNSTKDINIPLLNCVNVKKLLGFYGNCMLLPFTYPESLAKKLGKTAADVQNALYRHHSSNFRAPTTTISLPTDGMIGEAVLGETNVSEKIDLTRFWNWKDSPIDKMNIDSSYLNSNDYLAGKNTKDISGLNLQGATAATPVTVPDLVSALANKQAPNFKDITGLEQLKEVLNAGTKSAADGRDTAVKTSAEVAKAALDFLKPTLGAENKNNEEQNNNENSTSSSGSSSSGGGSDSSNGGSAPSSSGSDSSSKDSSPSSDGSDSSNGGSAPSGSSSDSSNGGSAPSGGGSDSSGDSPNNSDKGTGAQKEEGDSAIQKPSDNSEVNSSGDSTNSFPQSLLEKIIKSAIQSAKEGKTPLEFFKEFTGQDSSKEEVEKAVSAYLMKMGVSYDSVKDKLSEIISNFINNDNNES